MSMYSEDCTQSAWRAARSLADQYQDWEIRSLENTGLMNRGVAVVRVMLINKMADTHTYLTMSTGVARCLEEMLDHEPTASYQTPPYMCIDTTGLRGNVGITSDDHTRFHMTRQPVDDTVDRYKASLRKVTSYRNSQNKL